MALLPDSTPAPNPADFVCCVKATGTIFKPRVSTRHADVEFLEFVVIFAGVDRAAR